jgi:hypothetical protein
MEIEIGRAKRARRAYTFDDIAVVPSRRTRDPEDVSTAWTIDAYRSRSRCSVHRWTRSCRPQTAIMLGQLGGLGVLDLEGLWTRYENPEPLLAEIAGLDGAKATARMQEIYSEPIKPELITEPSCRGPRGRRHGRRLPDPAAHQGVLRRPSSRRRRSVRHPRHHGVGRARLQRQLSR